MKPGIVPRASTAVAEIARQLGVSTPTVYRYLNKSRED
ncbi:MAG TPA: helix-turn-helix domain-containing protein [Candidatus Gemmiger stercoravium]|nr:helix-turn-helix domain-containing protein [Candidatus Gemmiger stercoravium]